MKKILSIVLVMALLLSLAACTKTKPETPTTSPTENNDGIFYKNENIAIRNWSDFVFDFYRFEVSDEDLQMYVNYYILLPNAEVSEQYEGTVKKEDYIHVFINTRDKQGNVIPEYTTDDKGYFLYVGLGDYIKDIDRHVVGKNVGDTVAFETSVKVGEIDTIVDVSVTIDYIQITTLPEATDDLALKEGYNTLAEFKEIYKAQLEQEYADEAYKVFVDAVKKEVIIETYNYPEDLIQSYIDKYEESVKFFANSYKLSVEEYLEQFSKISYEDWLKQVQEQAKKDVETELFFQAVLEACGLTLDDEAYQHYLNQMAKQSGYANGQTLELDMKQQGLLDNLKRELMMTYAYDILLLTAKVRLVNWSTGEVIIDYVESNNSSK